MANPPRPAAREVAGVGVMLLCLGFSSVAKGAFFVGPLRVLELCVAVAAVAVVTAYRRLAWPAVIAALAVGGWFVVSGIHAGKPRLGIEEAAFLLVLALAASTMKELSPWGVDLVRNGMIAAGLIVAASACAGLALHIRPWALPLDDAWRASSTITYANATACLCVLTATLVVATSPRGNRLREAIVALCLLGAATTLCRAAISAAVVAVVALAVKGEHRRLRGYEASVVAAAIAFVGFVPSFALHHRPVVATAVLSCAAAAVFLLAPRTRVANAAGIATAAVGAAVVAGVWSWAPVFSRVSNGGSVSGRALSWHAFVDMGADHPVFGTGPSSFRVHVGVRGDALLFAHNEYLQVFAEKGAVGLVLVVGALALLGYFAWRSQRPAGFLIGAVVCAFALTDFVWNLPLIPLFGALMLGHALRTAPIPSSHASP